MFITTQDRQTVSTFVSGTTKSSGRYNELGTTGLEVDEIQKFVELTPAQLMLSGHPLNILVKNLALGGVAAGGPLMEGLRGGRGGERKGTRKGQGRTRKL